MKFEVLDFCSSKEGIAAAVDEQTQALGFDYWVYSVKVFRGTVCAASWSMHNFPKGLWSACCFDDKNKADPFTHRSRQHLVPKVWLIEEWRDSAGCSGPLFEAAYRAGITGGLCLPIHDVAGVVGTFVLTTIRPVARAALEAASTRALLFSKYLYEACRPYILQPPGEPPCCGIKLSPRELECLTWASRGKTAWEIGRLLDISEHTAVFHLRNASTKLGTSNRQQAVARFIQLGFAAL